MSKRPVAATTNDQQNQEKLDAFGMGIFLVVLGAGTLLAAWLLFQEATKKSIVEQFATATRAGDFRTLRESTDWASVRAWLKADIKSRPSAQHSGVPAKAKEVDEIVDYYVRPENLPGLLYYYNQNAGNMNPEAFVRNVRFSGLTEITVEIGAPPQFDKPWINSLEPVRVVFQLDGLSWKLKKLDAPDYLIPTRSPTVSFLNKRGA